jgi:hypothetical protein
LQGENHLPNLDFLAFLDLYFIDNAAHGRRNLNHRLFGFQFHDRLAFGNFGAWGDHQANQIALRNVFSEFLQAKFGRAAGLRSGLRWWWYGL